jgi:hypothetical protein
MKLQDLKDKGGFVPSAPVPVEVTWTRAGPDGAEVSDTFTIHVKRQSFGAIERLLLVDDKDKDRSQSARFIAETVCLGEKGKEAISYADAYALEPSLAGVFLKAINEVNGTARAEPKN